LQERESFVRFVGDASEFYQRINDPDEVTGLWGQLLHLAANNQVDDETIFEFPTEDDLFKVMYSPFTILFKNRLDGGLTVYTIRQPSF
jgi:hypothetical protein